MFYRYKTCAQKLKTKTGSTMSIFIYSLHLAIYKKCTKLIEILCKRFTIIINILSDENRMNLYFDNSLLQ